VATARRAPVLIYDANCGFCRRWVARLKRWDRRDRVRLLPLQDARAVELTGRPRAELEKAVHLVRPDGAVFAGAEAAREVLRYLPGGRLASTLLRPRAVMWIAARLYRWIARTWGPVRE
jgi:predicted DCC family thiol-disulfide oxidoreductase YuxK